MVVKKGYDFAGYATKNNILCTDGRTIRKNAFASQNGKTVPLVWNHGHDDPGNVIGHALLENRNDGVYCYCYLNNTKKAKDTKEIINHGDVHSLSIYANHLTQKAGDVLHGLIREVSVVLAGANSGAEVEWFPGIAHGDDEEAEMDGFILKGFYEDDFISHSDKRKINEDEEEPEEDEDEEPEDDEEEPEEDDEEPEDEEEDNDMNEKKKNLKHADTDSGSEETVQDVIDSMNEKQKNVMYALVGAAANGELDSSDKEDEEVKHNVFDEDTRSGNFLSHSDEQEIIADAKRMGSLKDAYLAHCESLGLDEEDALQHADAATYGIDHIEALFPEYKSLNTPPEWIKRDTTWVSKVLNAAHHIPFSRIKSMFANLTEDEARAKGYIKGKYKKEQVFSLLKRTTDPQTIYKKQKLDRDDQIDITDFDVVAWIKSEMRGQLDEELARAILVGDGRLTSDDDHISEEHIRPIWKDADLFAVKVTITMKANATDDDRARAFLRANLKARKYYKGSGSPSMFTTDSLLSDILLLEDGVGRMLYETDAAVATKCRVKEIVPVEIMEGLTDDTQGDLAAIVTNMADYNVGADKGGSVSMFEDFDIDYNQMKYLIETRCSGALVKPYSALVFSFKQGSGSTTTITFSGDGMDEFTIKDEDESAAG